MARAALRQLNEALEARQNTTHQVLTNPVIETLAKDRPSTTEALAAMHISRFAANMREKYGSQVVTALKQVRGAPVLGIRRRSLRAPSQTKHQKSSACQQSLTGSSLTLQ